MRINDKIEYNGSFWEVIAIDWQRGVLTISSINHGIKVISFNEYYSNNPWYSKSFDEDWKTSCYHEWKVYDSGWTRYEYCSKCNEEKK